MLFNIISYYIMSQAGDSSTSDWQGWFTLKNSSTFCRVKADFILFGCRVGNLTLSWNIWLNDTVPPGAAWIRALGHDPPSLELLTSLCPNPPPALPFVQLHFLMWFPFLQFLKYPTALVNIWIFFSFWIQDLVLLQNIPIVKGWDKRPC